MYKIELSNKEDTLELGGMLQRFFVESPYNDLCDVPSIEYLEQILNNAINECPSSFLVLTLKKEETPVGLFIAQIINHPFFPCTKYAQELMWFIDKEHRNNLKNCLDMLRAFDYWSSKNNCTHQVICHLETGNDILTKLYTSKKQNYSKIESSFIKRIS